VKALCRDCFWTGGEAPSPRRCPRCSSPRLVAHAELDTLGVAHMDCDAFYASVEKRDRPELRDLPVIVGGGVRGVVTTACYIARTYGPRSAMPMFKALKLCPDAVVIRPDFTKYSAVSRQVMGKMRDLTPLVQPLSLDEAWMDLRGSDRLHGGAPALTLAKLQSEIEREVGITVSIGLAPNKVLAKIASDLDKPRGFSVIGAQEAQAFLAPRSVTLLPGVGPAFAASLAKHGFTLIGQLAEADPKDLIKRFGAGGLRLHDLAHGRDARAVNPGHERKGMSAETTFDTDLITAGDLEAELWPLCEKLASKARRDGVASRVLVLKLRLSDFRIVTRRISLPEPVQTARALFAAGRALLAPELGRPYRLIGIGMAEIIEAPDSHALFETAETRALRTETAIDVLRAKFGAKAVVAGRALKD